MRTTICCHDHWSTTTNDWIASRSPTFASNPHMLDKLYTRKTKRDNRIWFKELAANNQALAGDCDGPYTSSWPYTSSCRPYKLPSRCYCVAKDWQQSRSEKVIKSKALNIPYAHLYINYFPYINNVSTTSNLALHGYNTANNSRVHRSTQTSIQ